MISLGAMAFYRKVSKYQAADLQKKQPPVCHRRLLECCTDTAKRESHAEFASLQIVAKNKTFRGGGPIGVCLDASMTPNP